MTKVSGNIGQLGIAWAIAGLGVSGGIAQLGVSGGLAEAGVTNIPPVFVSAEIGTVANDKVVMTFDKALDETSVPATTAFSLSGITGSPSVSAVAISTLYVTLTLSGDGNQNDTITVDYTKPGSNPLQDALNVEVDDFADETVTNNIEAAYSAQYQAVLDEMVNAPTEADAIIQNTMVEAYVAASLWDSKLDRKFITAVHTNDGGEAQLDWIDPVNSLPLVNVNGCGFTAYRGFESDGLTKYMRTQYNIVTDAVNYSQNSATGIFYKRREGSSARNDFGGGVSVGGPLFAGSFLSSVGQVYNRVNNWNTGGSTTQPSMQGMWVETRVSSANFTIWRNKNLVQTTTQASTGVPNIELYLLALNFNGTPDAINNNAFSQAAFGGGYSQTDIENETDIFETYLDEYGTGVIA